MTNTKNKKASSISIRPSIWRRANNLQRQELELLINEMNKSSEFILETEPIDGTWSIRLGLTSDSLIIAIVDEKNHTHKNHSLLLEPIRKNITTYLSLIKKMGDNISGHNMTHLEALDMARRATHNEASKLVQSYLEGFLLIDIETARRLFTVICIVYDTPAL